MALRLVDYHGGYFVPLAVVAGKPAMGSGSTTIFNTINTDPLVPLLANQGFPIGWYRVEDYLQLSYLTGDPDEVVYEVVPKESKYVGSSDWSRYGSSRLSQLLSALPMLTGGGAPSVSGFKPRNEHEVLHENMKGTVGPGLSYTPYYEPGGASVYFARFEMGGGPNSPGNYWAYDRGILKNTPVMPLPVLASNLSYPHQRHIGRIRAYPDGSGTYAFDIPKNTGDITEAQLGNTNFYRSLLYGSIDLLLPWLRDAETTGLVFAQRGPGGSPWWGATLRHYVSGLRVRLFPKRGVVCSIDYNLRVEIGFSNTLPINTSASHTWQDRVVRWELLWSPPSRNKVLPATQPQSYEASFGDVTTRVSGQVVGEGYTPSSGAAGFGFGWGSRWPVGYEFSSSNTQTRAVWCVGAPSKSEGRGGASLTWRFNRFSKRGMNHSFAREIEKDFHNIRPTYFLSSADCIDTLIDGIDDNLIEALSQISSVFDVFPDTSKAISVLRNLVAGHKITSLAEALDLITSWRLKTKFGIDPNIGLLEQQLPKIPYIIDSINKLSTGSGVVVSRGSFKHHFDFNYGRHDVNLTTRTKVVARASSSEAFAKLMGVHSMGLLPVPSRAWDLVPFSFVADWFINIGQRMADLENATILSLLNIESFTHSYLIRSPITEGELAMEGLKPYQVGGIDRDDYPTLHFFKREVSKYLPLPTESKYDFRLPSRPPNWMTAGSLFFQTMLSGK